MRLKILIVPFFVIMTLIIGIGYVQPEFALMQERQAQLADKEIQVSKLETTLSNIRSMNDTLDAKPDSERFVMNALPASLDQEKTIDMLNFLATQSGLLMTDLVVAEVSDTAQLNVLPESSYQVPYLSGAGSQALIPTDITVPLLPSTAEAYTVRAQVRGSYENIKTFLSQAAHSNRSYRIRLLEVSADTQAAVDPVTGLPLQVGTLAGSFEAYFDYLPKTSVRSALDMPVFQKGQLDFSPASRMLERMQGTVPELEKPVAGKANPFQ